MADMPRKIYVASSWRNTVQPDVVSELRFDGHEVYDFRNPGPSCPGFGWETIHSDWQNWTPDEYLQALKHPKAERGFFADWTAMRWADVFLLVLPCGRSAHLELGWAVGAGKTTAILLDEESEPELMYKMVDDLFTSLGDVRASLLPLV